MTAICLASSTTSVAPCSAQSAAAVTQALTAQGNPLFDDCQSALLPSARETYADLMEHMAQAEHYIHLEYFIFRRDSIGNALLHLLHQKASEGVDVRLLIDAYGNRKSPLPIRSAQLDSIRSLGIKVALFDPIRFPWIPNTLSRDHRKIAVVDGRWAWTGGINIADYYLHGTARTGTWRDLQVRLSGSVAREFERIFARIWQKTTGDPSWPPLKGEEKASPFKGEVGEGLFNSQLSTFNFQLYKESVVLVNREPGKQSKKMRRAYRAAFDSARHEVMIVNPYPTLVPSVRRAMRRALRRGVRMRIMVSSRSDNRITPELVALEMLGMAKRGADVLYYDEGFHHTKVITVDDSLALLGTTNLDARSLRFDYELTVALRSPRLVDELQAIYRDDSVHSHPLTRDNYRRLFPLRKRMLARILRSLRGLL